MWKRARKNLDKKNRRSPTFLVPNSLRLQFGEAMTQLLGLQFITMMTNAPITNQEIIPKGTSIDRDI
jgi:hypothetical protein